ENLARVSRIARTTRAWPGRRRARSREDTPELFSLCWREHLVEPFVNDLLEGGESAREWLSPVSSGRRPAAVGSSAVFRSCTIRRTLPLGSRVMSWWGSCLGL